MELVLWGKMMLAIAGLDDSSGWVGFDKKLARNFSHWKNLLFIYFSTNCQLEERQDFVVGKVQLSLC